MYLLQNTSHNIYKCPEFEKLSYQSKSEFVKNGRLCNNCLRSNDTTANCKSTVKCKYCRQNHNSLIHPQNTSLNVNAPQTSGNCATYQISTFSDKEFLLPTAVIFIKDEKNIWHECRAQNRRRMST